MNAEIVDRVRNVNDHFPISPKVISCTFLLIRKLVFGGRSPENLKHVL
jgi:hypothetical protein